MSDIKTGDRVKVTIEGELLYTGTRSVEVRTNDGKVVEAYTPSGAIDALAVIEKIEPPVEVFGPGVVVRSKESGTLRAPLAGGGWVNITTGKTYEGHGHLTSESYERVL